MTIACGQYLISHKYTSPEHRCGHGCQQRRPAMGATITQRALSCSVVSSVGIYDMLRTELGPNGAFDTTEFGTVKEPAQFRALYAHSPNHQVKDGTKYPAILLASIESFPRPVIESPNHHCNAVRCILLRSSIYLESRCRPLKSGSVSNKGIPASRCLYARSSHSNDLSGCPRYA